MRAALAALLILAAAAPAPAASRLVADGPAGARGPGSAAGAVLWSPAAERDRDADPAPAPFVQLLREAGFDVFRLERDRTGVREEDEGAMAVSDAARELRGRGYARIVAAGQSAGGWLALLASAMTRGAVDAVVATSPAVHGPIDGDAARAERARARFLRIADHVDRVPTMVFLFAGDEFDPGGRGAPLARSLARRGVPHVVVDAPAGWRGHGVAMTRAFARRFGNCIVAFVATPAPRDGLACDAFPAAALPFEFALPAGWSPPAAANENAPGAGWIGAWRGSLDNGDDVLVAVERVAGGRADALLARGRSRAEADDRAVTRRRAGRVDPAGVVTFPAGDGAPAFALRRAANDALAVEIVGERRRYRGTLERLR